MLQLILLYHYQSDCCYNSNMQCSIFNLLVISNLVTLFAVFAWHNVDDLCFFCLCFLLCFCGILVDGGGAWVLTTV